MVFWYYRRLVNTTIFKIAGKGVQVVHDSLRRPEWRGKITVIMPIRSDSHITGELVQRASSVALPEKEKFCERDIN